MDLFGGGNGAIFDRDKNYRYALWKKWNLTKQMIMFIGLNPSTANEYIDDPTIRRVQRFAFDNGYGGFYMMNLFAYISSDPKQLLSCQDPLGKNDEWLNTIYLKTDIIIFCWGSFQEAKQRAKYITDKFEGFVLAINKDGSPGHPLYLPKNSSIIKYDYHENRHN